MPHGLRVGVLSPFVGGDYFGAVIAGLHAAVTADGGRLIAVQTLDPGSKSADYSGVPAAALPLAWDHLDGVVIVARAARESSVRRMLAAGKPVVLVSHRFADVPCPSVAPDNRSGVRDAVAHLVGHGHRRIGFSGFLGVDDVVERHAGYREALAAHGLPCPPDLLFEVADNSESGGAAAAAALREAARDGKPPVTAVVMGTDRNAVGLLDALAATGWRVPQDLAVVGFDDIPQAAYLRPSLSTVAQPLDRLGELAYGMLRDAVDGRPQQPDALVPTRFVPRGSCGCAPDGDSASAEDVMARFAENAFLQRALNTQYDLGIELLRSHERDPRGLTWLGVTPAAAGCLALWPGAQEDADAVVEAPLPPSRRVEPSEGPFEGPFEGLFGEPFDGSTGEDPASDDPAEPGDPMVEIAGTYRADGGPVPAAGQLVPVSAFPPQELLDAADATDGILCLVRVRTPAHDWGVLAAVTQVQWATPSGRELINYSGSLLAVALEHEAVLSSLTRQQEQLRRAALFDQLTGLPNRSLLLDRLRRSRHRTGRGRGPHLALLFLDLDGFKAVNDSLGHAAGDELLVGVAQRLTTILRRSDTAARLGGDEFVVLLDGLQGPDDAAQAADRIRSAVTDPFEIEGRAVTVGVSIGISGAGQEAADPDDLLRRADAAMYQAKQSSRGSAVPSPAPPPTVPPTPHPAPTPAPTPPQQRPAPDDETTSGR